MVVVEGDRHPVVREHQEGQRARLDLVIGDQVAHQGLKEGLVRDPGGAEKPHDIAALAGHVEDPLDGAAAQAPPLAADLHLQIRRDRPRQTQPFLQPVSAVKQCLLGSFVEIVPIDQPVILHPGLDPVAVEEIETLDVIDIARIEKAVGIFRRLDRHAVARQHVEMGGAGKRLHRGLQRVQRGLHQRPFAPAAFDPAAHEGDIGVVGQRGADAAILFGIGAGVEMDRQDIARRGQPLRLLHNRLGVFVAEQDIRDLCHMPISSA